ncbi:ferredoxin [Streptomyces sp. VRA16 Mangrove soil]|uniref:ferredoxin n=1 Tax=Streptomyces sp. VRA16 Mangrove soil TaxID=2817434 RepID=UPI001A9EC152|nr:ferredoxin [Streptomyces sp. VRA16 Mangrove soil]
MAAELPAGPAEDDRVRFLEDRFSCAQSCTECARACAVLVSSTDLGVIPPTGSGPVRPAPAGPAPAPGAPTGLRRALLLGVEVCDATCRLLSEETLQDEYALRLQVEWCRAVALECAHACDAAPEAADCAERCRACARACTDFLATLERNPPPAP